MFDVALATSCGGIACESILGNLEPDSSHQAQGVSRGDRAGTQRVVKKHFTLPFILYEVMLADFGHQFFWQTAKLHIVGGDHTKGATAEEL